MNSISVYFLNNVSKSGAVQTNLNSQCFTHVASGGQGAGWTGCMNSIDSSCDYTDRDQCITYNTLPCFSCVARGIANCISNNDTMPVGTFIRWFTPDSPQTFAKYAGAVNASMAANSNMLIFALQGTQDFKNVIEDLEDISNSPYLTYGQAGVGNIRVANDIYNNFVYPQLNKHIEYKNIVFAGHSLGAAAAALIALRVARDNPNLYITFIGFATPTIGDSALAKSANATPNLNIKRVIAVSDPIGSMSASSDTYWGSPLNSVLLIGGTGVPPPRFTNVGYFDPGASLNPLFIPKHYLSHYLELLNLVDCTSCNFGTPAPVTAVPLCVDTYRRDPKSGICSNISRCDTGYACTGKCNSNPNVPGGHLASYCQSITNKS